MSVVACKINENGYEIAADSITVRGITQTKSQTDHVKLYEANEMVIGGVGSAEENSLMRLFAETHRPSSSEEYALLEFISEFVEWKKRKTDDKTSLRNAFIIGYQGNVFVVEQWHVHKVNSYMAIGAGMSYALAALYLGHSAEKAVETAIELSTMCEEPILVIKKSSGKKVEKKKKNVM
jgi:ATP-dependent protease HslVU (ClpYQ) peptidase subunit